jgi:integrase
MGDRRGKQEGSVYQRKDGRWVASICVDGQRYYRYGQSVWDALEQLEAIKKDACPTSDGPASRITLGEWIDRWLTEISPDIRPSTRNTYRYTLKPISEEIGNVHLNELSSLLLSETFTRIRERGKGARQLNLAHGYLKACLKHAVNLEIIDKNPMDKVRRPKWTQRERVYWNLEEVNRFIRTGLGGERYWDALFVFLCVTGLRVSEALALRWDDVAHHDRMVKVERATVWRGSHYDEVEPKTKAGIREVSVPAVARIALDVIRSRKIPNPEDRIFTTKHGTPPRLSDLAKYLSSLCQRAEVRRMNVHGLRHVAAMLALEAVNDPYLVQKRLGHSHISVTLGIYGYTSRDESEVGSQMDRLLDSSLDS